MVSEKVKAFDQSAKVWNRDQALSRLSQHDPAAGSSMMSGNDGARQLIGASMPLQAMARCTGP